MYIECRILVSGGFILIIRHICRVVYSILYVQISGRFLKPFLQNAHPLNFIQRFLLGRSLIRFQQYVPLIRFQQSVYLMPRRQPKYTIALARDVG